MRRASRAASTTSGLMVRRLLICWMRWIWVSRRSTRRKLPPVIRAMVAIATVRVSCSVVVVVVVDAAAGREAVGVPAAGEHGGELVGVERAVLVSEADAAVQLGVARQAPFDAGHADQDHAHGVPVVVVADLLQAGGLEPVGLIDDEQLGEPGREGLGVHERVDVAVLVVVDGVGDLLAGPGQGLVDLLRGRGDGRRPHGGANVQDSGRDWPRGCAVVGAQGALPLLPGVGPGVVPGGQGLADAGRAPADADVAVPADGVGELGEPAVLPSDQERWPVLGWGRPETCDLTESAGQEAVAVVVLAENASPGCRVIRWHRYAAGVRGSGRPRVRLGRPAALRSVPPPGSAAGCSGGRRAGRRRGCAARAAAA